jgi:hypothetical protein
MGSWHSVSLWLACGLLGFTGLMAALQWLLQML